MLQVRRARESPRHNGVERDARGSIWLWFAIVLSISAGLRPGPTARAQVPAADDTTRPVSTQSFDVPEAGAVSPRNANYDIDVRLDTETRRLQGRETIRWRNISRRPAAELQFHLYWNAWRDLDSTWLRESRLAGGTMPSRPEHYGSIDVSALRLRQPDGTTVDLAPRLRFIAPDDGNAADRTVMAVDVPSAIQPNETALMEIEWTSKIPFPFARLRTGAIGDYYFLAQWFPKIGVLEDDGWNTHQFHSSTEFYADYGVYDVRLTLPRDFIVGASGREQGRTDNGDGTATHRYLGNDIHDFAWTASPRFLESRQTFEYAAPAQGAPSRVEMRLLLQPEHAGQEDRHFSATAATLRHYGEWFGRYPYDHITIVDPAYQSGSQGMEYPTLFTAGSRWIAPRAATVPESVTIHEAGHQFFYGVIGTNEVEHAWMDEGINQYAQGRVIETIDHPNRLALRFFGGFVPWVVRDVRLQRATDVNRLNTFRPNAEAEAQASPSYRYWPGTSVAITYDKTALWLHTLERHLGWPVMQEALSTYYERWKFRHPTPDDFFRVLNEVSGQDLTWFVDQVHRSSNTFDYGVQDLVNQTLGEGAFRTTVVVRRFGEATFPVEVATTFANGERAIERWDGVDRRAVFVYERPARASLVQIDPRRVLLLDVNYANNSRMAQPRSAEASLKWAAKWMTWLQDLMLTYAFFV